MFFGVTLFGAPFQVNERETTAKQLCLGLLDTDLDMFELGRPSYKVYAGFTGAWTPSDGRWLAYVLILLY